MPLARRVLLIQRRGLGSVLLSTQHDRTRPSSARVEWFALQPNQGGGVGKDFISSPPAQREVVLLKERKYSSASDLTLSQIKGGEGRTGVSPGGNLFGGIYSVRGNTSLRKHSSPEKPRSRVSGDGETPSPRFRGPPQGIFKGEFYILRRFKWDKGGSPPKAGF